MPRNFSKPQAGQLKEVHEPRLVGEVIVDNLTNSNDQPFSGIRQQLASGCLPNLAQHLDAVASNLREKPNPCFDIETRAKI